MSYFKVKESERIDFQTFLLAGTICVIVKDSLVNNSFSFVQVVEIDESKSHVSVQVGEVIAVNNRNLIDCTEQYEAKLKKERVLVSIKSVDHMINEMLATREKLEQDYIKLKKISEKV